MAFIQNNFGTVITVVVLAALIGGLAYVFRKEIVEYYRESLAELRKVVWPTRIETRQLTIVVLITVILSAVFLGLADALYERVFALVFGS